MRIIHGLYKGFQFPAFHGSNTRPTSDLVKESLFNTLSPLLELEGETVIDLFAGTGNIGLECLSRGAAKLISVDHELKNVRYMQDIRKKLNIVNWEILRMDALQFIARNEQTAAFVFADPPYDYPPVHDMVNKLLAAPWFNTGASVFVLEHVDRLVFKDKHVFLNKQYGNTAFTGFRSGQ